MTIRELKKQINENQGYLQQEWSKLFDLGFGKKDTKEYKDIEHNIRQYLMHAYELDKKLDNAKNKR